MIGCGWIVYLVSISDLSLLHVRSLIVASKGVNYLAFDIVGDLAFGAPFGMLRAGKDSAPVPQSNEEAIKCYGDSTSASDIRELPAVQNLNGRGEYSMTMGVFPSWWRPIMAKTPWFSQGKEDVKTLAGSAIMAVSKRLAAPTDRNDLLSKLQAGKDEHVGSKVISLDRVRLCLRKGQPNGTRRTHSRSSNAADCRVRYYIQVSPIACS